MKMFLISDNNDTLTGLRLAGIDGVRVQSREELRKALADAFADKEIGLLLLTEKFGKMYPDIVLAAKSRNEPLVLDIPDRHGTGRSPEFIMEYVNKAIGLKL